MSRQKRRKIEHIADSDTVQNALPELVSQIVTEISLRDRLAQTLQARIDWALALKNVLETGRGKGIRTTPENFQQLASEALIKAELPSQILFSTAQDLVTSSTPSAPVAAPTSVVQVAPLGRPPRTKAPASKGKPSFLYVSTAQLAFQEYGNETYLLLKCPVCSRTAFSSLQGLLNHARISHSIEWGTHDACIKACAVVEPNLDIDAGTEVGVGPSGIRPGLQTIFERAVGLQQPQPPPLSGIASENKKDQLISQRHLQGFSGKSPSVVANVSQSLGLHEGTSGLAPFLGKEAHRREIKVYDEDVNIKSNDTSVGAKPRLGWRMTFAQRHNPLLEVPVNLPLLEDGTSGVMVEGEKGGVDRGEPPTTSVPSATFVPSSKTRFHFSARVAISDRSLFVNSASTPKGTFSRKWMIAVASPSYAVPLSTVLKYVKVTPMAGDDTFYLPVPVVREPPYVVLGLSNTPFLARVEVGFNDIKEQGRTDLDGHEPQITVIEQWVDLDPLKSTSVVLGEEQLVDIELDRRTEIKAPVLKKLSFDSRQLWNDSARLPLDATHVPVDDNQEVRSEEYRLFLETEKRFPLTQQAKDRSQTETRIPYRLVSSRTQFNHLILGRQQSIKWGRARAIRDSYFDALASANLILPTLSVADIYRWLEERIQLSSKTQRQPLANERGKAKFDGQIAGEDQKAYCLHCGFEEKYHDQTLELLQSQQTKREVSEEQQAPSEGYRLTSSCLLLQDVIFPQLQVDVPRIHPNAGEFAAAISQKMIRKPLAQLPSGTHRKLNRVLVQSVDPAMLSFVEEVVKKARISGFGCTLPSDRRDPRPYHPIDNHGSDRDQVEKYLTPLAVLTRTVEGFLLELVANGTKQAMLEKSIVMRALASKRGSKRVGDQVVETVLAPRHIQSGNNSCEVDGGFAGSAVG